MKLLYCSVFQRIHQNHNCSRQKTYYKKCYLQKDLNMSNENYNNTGDWRSRLEALDNLPGEPLIDKNASWEKLHDRLREKKGNKKIIWYWSAAACLLLVLMIPLINSNKKDHEPVKTGTAQKQAG